MIRDGANERAVLDLGPREATDFAQDIHIAEDGTAAIAFWSGRVELVREMGPVMPRGGGAPFFGEQRQVQVVGGNYAWNVPPPAPNAARSARYPRASSAPYPL